MDMIGKAVSEQKMFEIVYDHVHDDYGRRRTGIL